MELKNRKKRQLEKAEMKIKALYKKLEELNQESNGILKKGMLRKDLNPAEEAANLKIAQLLGHANFIIQKNEILVQLETNYNGLKESKIGDLSKKISDLGAVINSNYNAEKDWENFLVHFESVFPNYLKQIKEKNPGQTVLEIKVSVLKKVALTLHEMSHILHIPEEEIEKTLESLNSRQGRIETV
ncbi:MAG TPA: hypothetical protein VD908_06315 [Cytophagales bacterium]|nr:hypothetical protein [Cytophagales bacterium]